MEQLLNKLIELWWKPRGYNNYISAIMTWKYELSILQEDRVMWVFSLNDLCSIDSWLRQFVCWLNKDFLPFCSKCNIKLESNNDKIKWDVWYEEEVNFRLMLSSIQEDKERFLLDNIIIPNEKTSKTT
jgi:hypothetical protein